MISVVNRGGSQHVLHTHGWHVTKRSPYPAIPLAKLINAYHGSLQALFLWHKGVSKIVDSRKMDLLWPTTNQCTYLTKHDHLYYCLGPSAPIATSPSWFTVYVHTCVFKYSFHAYIRLLTIETTICEIVDTLSQFWPISWVSPMMSSSLASTLGILRNVPTLPLTTHSSPCQSSSFRTKKVTTNLWVLRFVQEVKNNMDSLKLKGSQESMFFFGHFKSLLKIQFPPPIKSIRCREACKAEGKNTPPGTVVAPITTGGLRCWSHPYTVHLGGGA